ncbi:MAG: sugar phosphate isomerase/epimerase [Candidatus Hydrogenedentes bacterium]|nr:sugar phosphate isomerase/epimerase [Candidatus Hydrogenedentota bacterium]
MFRIGLCYPMSWDVGEVRGHLARLRKFGYEGIEFWPVSLDKMDIAELADILQDTGVACAQICPYFDFVHGQEKWDETLRIAERYVSWSLQLGKPLIRVFTGPGVGPAEATVEQWEAAFRGLQRVCDMAAPHGIRLALECHGGSLMADSPGALRLLAGVGRPNLGVNPQLPLKDGHETIDTTIEQLGHVTWHMHTHNYTALVGGHLLPLAEGVLDYGETLPRLMAKGFDGYVSIEHANHEGRRDPWEIAEIEGAYLTKLREELSRRNQ